MSVPINRSLSRGHISPGHRFETAHPWSPQFGYDMYYNNPTTGRKVGHLDGLKPEEARVLANKHNLPMR